MRTASYRTWIRARRVGALAATVAITLLLEPTAGPRPLAADLGTRPLVLAGCGANVPITRLLAAAFMRTHPGLAIEIRTVGSTNGISLALAGAVHLSLVSRPLRDEEGDVLLTFIPYARTPIVVAAHPTVRDEGLTSEDVVRIVAGTEPRWSTGHPIGFIAREIGDSSIEALRRQLSGFALAYAEGENTSHWRIRYSEAAMHRSLAETPFAMGVTDLGLLTVERLRMKALGIDRIAPTLENLASGRYPLVRTLAFVFRDDVLPAAGQAFVAFVRSDGGERILRANGYLADPWPHSPIR